MSPTPPPLPRLQASPPHVTGNIKQMSFNSLYGDAPATTFDPPLPSLPRVANGGESIILPSDLPPPLYEEVSASRKAAKLAANPQYGAVGGANRATPNPQYGSLPGKLLAPLTEEHMYASLKDPSHLQTSQLEQQQTVLPCPAHFSPAHHRGRCYPDRRKCVVLCGLLSGLSPSRITITLYYYCMYM